MSLVLALASVTVIRHPIRTLCLLIWPVRRSHVFQHFVSTYSACHTLCGFFTLVLRVRILISRVTVSLDDCTVPNYRLVVHWLDIQEFKSSRIVTYSLLKCSLCPRVAPYSIKDRSTSPLETTVFNDVLINVFCLWWESDVTDTFWERNVELFSIKVGGTQTGHCASHGLVQWQFVGSTAKVLRWPLGNMSADYYHHIRL